MSDIQVNQLLQQMRSMAAMAEQGVQAGNGIGAGLGNVMGDGMQVNKSDFGQMLTDSINHVNQTQKAAGASATAFETGDPNVNLSEVMVAIQKASVSCQEMTKVRNNLV
jgi:flagellar hook-basal body complex protein FliE